MKTIAILDTETTDVDPFKGHLLEVGCVLWSVEHRAIIESRSWLVANGDLNVNPAIAVNGIEPALLFHGYDEPIIGEQLALMTADVDAYTAWNAGFDSEWIAVCMPGALNDSKPWFDAMDDLEWPRASSSRKLVEVALAHGVGVVDAHRALTDCLTIARLLDRVAFDLDALDQGRAEGGEATRMPGSFVTWLERSLRPKVHVEVPWERYDAAKTPAKNEVYKAHGFRWNPKPVERWRRKMFREDAAKLPFEVVEVRS